MKLTRIQAFACPFGRLEFIPAQPGFRALWRASGQDTFRQVAWFESETWQAWSKKRLALARWCVRKAVAEDQGKPPYSYCDTNTDPKP